MLRLIFSLLVFLPLLSYSQTDTTKWLRAFPITEYMVPLNDSLHVVQLDMPDGLVFKDKQLGLVYGVYNGSREVAVQKGFGKCHLKKGNYYYFSIGNNSSGLPLKQGELVYTFFDKTSIWYGQIPQLAGHFYLPPKCA